MRILITLITSLCLTLPAYAELSVIDLPFIEGTPLEQTSAEGPAWTLLDYAEADGSLAWAWLENAGALAYVVYPSASGSVVFPDGTSVDSDPENIVLRFAGDDHQVLEFSRFDNSLISLVGANTQVSYTIGEGTGNSAEGIYVGNVHIESEKIIVDYSAEIDGNLDLVAADSISVTGLLNLGENHFSAYAQSNLIIGKIYSAEGVLHVCETDFESLPPTINLGTPFGHKVCSGDFITPAGAVTVSEPAKNPAAVSQTSGGSKGGNTGGLLMGLLAILALFRRKLSW